MVEDFRLKKNYELSFIYGLHTVLNRMSLWRDLSLIYASNSGTLWMVLGDFNEVLSPNEISGGNQVRDPGIEGFNNFVLSSCLSDLRYTRSFYTWSNKRVYMDDFIERKIDRALTILNG